MWVWAKRILLVLLSASVLTLAAGATYQWSGSTRDLARTPPPGQLVDVGALRLHLWCMGTGSPAVLFDSGIGGTAFDWPLVQPQVAKFTKPAPTTAPVWATATPVQHHGPVNRS